MQKNMKNSNKNKKRTYDELLSTYIGCTRVYVYLVIIVFYFQEIVYLCLTV